MRILDQIHGPGDVKKLNGAQRITLCGELRDEIIQTVLQNGGHLASNLGVVELTVALHTVFDSPKDKIIWDVGHQSYAHKLLTGRRERFSTIRQYKGLSGFPKAAESEHDAFDVGHASTSISAALGYVRARDLLHEDYHVVAVVGDGALTGGMCFEALDDAGQSESGMIVVLNDNAMSISKNVGGIGTYLGHLRVNPHYVRFKHRVKRRMSAIPGIGKPLARFTERMRDRIKFFVLPRVFFEEIGFTYLGPFNGHDLSTLTEMLSDAKALGKPVILHIVTHKGQGYRPAETNPEKYHGVSPQPIASPQKQSRESNSALVGRTLCNMAKTNTRIVAVTAAMPSGTGLNLFGEQYPARMFDVGICEEHAITMSAGMAKGGLKPYVALYSTFLQRGYDQILIDVCMQNLPVVFCIDRAGLTGEDGETHQGVFDIAMLLSMPNMRLYAPAAQQELVAMLEAAQHIDGPCSIRYPRGALPAGQADAPLMPYRILSPLEEVTIIVTGKLLPMAEQAVQMLKEKGIYIGLVQLLQLKPLDSTLLSQLETSCKRLLTIEDGVIIGGIGSRFAQWAGERRDLGVVSMGIPDAFISQGKVEQLFDEIGLTKEEVARRAMTLWEELHG